MRETKVTACPLDCPDTCSLHVVVESGRLVSVDAAPLSEAQNSFTQGFICKKVKGHADRVHGDDRVMTPLIRTGPKGRGTFRSATWDEAMSLVADRMRAAVANNRPASIVPYLYNSSTGLAASGSLGPELFDRLGASHVLHTICAATSGCAMHSVVGSMVASDPADVEFSDCIIVWGANPSVSNTHLPPIINRATRGQGAKLLVIDPRATGIARRADLHVAIRPGTDAVLAFAVTNLLAARGALDDSFIRTHTSGWDDFAGSCAEWTLDRAAELCGVAPAEIEMMASLLAASNRPFLRLGWGMERNHNGGAAIRAALSLRLALGRFGERGSGFVLSTGAASPWDSAVFRPPTRSSGTRRHVNQNLLGEMLNDATLDPPIDVLFVQGANPVVMNPDQEAVLRGFAREDLFTVVHEQVLTDTARWADVVLPATTHFEVQDATGSYGTFTVQHMPSVIDRVGESRSNVEVISELASLLNVPLDIVGLDEVIEAGLGDRARTPVVREPDTTVPFRDTFPTFSDRRARFSSVVFENPGAASHPLVLLSPASPRVINSMFGERAHEPVLTIHPIDAQSRGVVDGTRIRVWNDLGSIEVKARVDVDVRPGVVSLPKGDWLRNYGTQGRGVNVLVPATVDPTVGGACFNDTRVEVAAL